MTNRRITAITKRAIPIVRYLLILSSLCAWSSVELDTLFLLLAQRNNKKSVIAERIKIIDANCSVFFNAFSYLSAPLD